MTIIYYNCFIKPFFPNVIGYIVIVITIAILICNLVVRLYFNVRRNNIEIINLIMIVLKERIRVARLERV